MKLRSISKVPNFVRVLTVLGALSVPTLAATLKIGDPAPPLLAGKWVQGQPLQAFDSNHVYAVEFWATWWAPCQDSLARLNGISEKYAAKGLVAIGQDVFEKDDSDVAMFVKKMGDKMTYRVALDDKSRDKEGAMAVNWMKAAGQTGVPTIFIVDRLGRIAWIGHPMALEQSVLEEILADQFDVAASGKEFEKQRQKQDQQQVLAQKLSQALKAGNWDAADAAVTEMENTLPEAARYKVSPVRLQILIHRKDYAGAYRLAESTSDAWPNDAYLQNEMAWALATSKGVGPQGLMLAQKIAGRASVAAGGNNSGILDTLARAQFLNGQTNEAVATEQKALNIASDEFKADLKKCLSDYQQGRLPEVKE